ncbi:hypothetical protein DVS28_a3526 [Euzebya pacifica]|uniref:Uncharacterized protein n=1 Tax=Euzebya pacifica TaxID=1608957 RepID=A0A346Y152_9ACTN|nr:hypothetical protein DVS28_a3526 [Euzebya pacifica]
MLHAGCAPVWGWTGLLSGCAGRRTVRTVPTGLKSYGQPGVRKRRYTATAIAISTIPSRIALSNVPPVRGKGVPCCGTRTISVVSSTTGSSVWLTGGCVGWAVGASVGGVVGDDVGCGDGCGVGEPVGDGVGMVVGVSPGSGVGCAGGPAGGRVRAGTSTITGTEPLRATNRPSDNGSSTAGNPLADEQ